MGLGEFGNLASDEIISLKIAADTPGGDCLGGTPNVRFATLMSSGITVAYA